MLNKGEGRKARSLPEIVDMESVSGVSTRTEPTVSAVESSACQVPLQRPYGNTHGETSPGPTNDPGFFGSDELHVNTVFPSKARVRRARREQVPRIYVSS